jgi:hypothetical protein
MYRAVFLVLVLLTFTTFLAGQTASTGTVIGTVMDPSGAIIPGVPIELRDIRTGVVRTTISNEAGRYAFPGVLPGTYALKASLSGFQDAVVPQAVVELGKSYTVDFQLQIGTVVAEVTTATAGAELQTLDASVGTVVEGDSMLLMPSMSRSATSLLLFQPTSIPQQASTQNSTLGGQVAGAHSDQNTIVLDGGNVTNGISANNDYFVSFNGGPEGAIPTPIESIEEFRVSTSNPSASFSGSSGSETVLVTKRGTNEFHGSAYLYLQNDELNANTWERNRFGQVRPESRDNRFGASLGGYVPKLSESAKTYFYMNYEGRRSIASSQFSRQVPTETLKRGILRFRDATGNIISYDLSRSAACGAQGNSACDPRGLGLNPLVGTLWNNYEPVGNDISQGDGLNTTGFSAPLSLPISSDFGVLRLDHAFGSKWQAFTSYRYYTETAAVNRQVDIGGLLPGHTKAQPASAATIPREPRYVVLGLTGILSPTLTNEVNFGYLRDWWYWNTASVFPQLPGTAAALAMGGNVTTQLQPISFRTNDARQRAWSGHNYNFRDNVSWQKGNHFIRAGGTYSKSIVNFFRDDGQLGVVKPTYLVTQTSGLNIPANFRPPACAGAVTTNCLPSNQASNWNNLYAQALGLVDQGLVVGVRASDLSALPPGTLLSTRPTYDTFSLYMTDSWKVTPNLTLNYGLNWSVEPPPVDALGKYAMSLVQPNNAVLVPENYLATRQQAALNGTIYNPTVGFAPLSYTNRKYPYDRVLDTVAPRVAMAWNPKFNSGFMERVFGDGRTAIRAGYGQLFDRLNGVQKVGNFLQGFGFQQTLVCLGPSRSGQCLGISGIDPSTGFRIAVDGSTVPIPSLSASATPPLIPGVAGFPGANQTQANTTYQIDPHYRPGRNHQWDLTIQRELSGNSLLEIGYIGRHANNIYNPLEVNQVPYMMTLNGQTYAQAFDAIAGQLKAGVAVTPQPFFEAALAGSSLCAPPNTSCTAGVVSKFSGSFPIQHVTDVWNGIQPSFKFGPATAATNQVQTMFYWASTGWANYNAGFISYRTRSFRGLTLNGNFTWSHSLDTRGLNQDQDTAASNSYNLHYDYGTSVFDRKFVFNLLSLYELPFMRNKTDALSYVVKGWSLAPVINVSSGLPLKVLTGSTQEFGQGGTTNSGGAVLLTKDTFGNNVHSGVSGDVKTQAGVNGDPTRGGTGLNLFSDPAAVFKSFRPALVSVDTTSSGGGQLRGLPRWNVDLAISRKFRFGERWSTTFSGQFFNLFNVVQFAEPTVNLQSPQSFGVLSTQLNQPRVIQLGLHIDF